MKKLLSFAAILVTTPISFLVGAQSTVAQGPAGVGAAAAQQDTSHSLNPVKWIKKDPKNSDAPANRTDTENSRRNLGRSQA